MLSLLLCTLIHNACVYDLPEPPPVNTTGAVQAVRKVALSATNFSKKINESHHES